MKELVINETVITTDSKGRFSLNDLHIAAGGEKKHKPALFFKLDSVAAMVDILKVDNPTFEPVSKVRGRYNGGTWVCKELVYKYAMWIRPEFEIKVIRTFDELNGSIAPPKTMDAMNSIVKKIESDKNAASICGKELARYKKIKKQNEEYFSQGVKSVQIALGFSGQKEGE